MFFIVRIVAIHYVLVISCYNSVIHGMDRIVQSVEKKYKKSDPACKHRVTKENTSKEMLTHEKRTIHSRSIFD